ncbi:MAG TPA: glycosyl hydrolase [Hymenobacter sp.]|jgi:mannan endo-1,4-beta-mannosidase|uniref:glycosyl hydrolase n=1 Tax=Hymenobacter sp. TaxID=1898978 RepID=UPI002ED8DF40
MKQAYSTPAPPRGRAAFFLLCLLALLPGALRAASPIKLEAEKATLHGARVLRDTPGYSGAGYAGNFEGATDSLTFSFAAAAGWYDLAIRYTSPYGDKEYQLAVNGRQSGYSLAGPVAGFGNSRVGRFQLKAGTNTITLKRGWGYFGIDYVSLTPVSAARNLATVPLVNGRAEAELGDLSGVQVSATPTGFSGTGYVTGFDAAADNVSLTFDVTTAGLYKIDLGYTSPFGEKDFALSVNGEQSVGRFALTGNAFATASAGTFLLTQGLNTVVVGRGWGYFGVDYLQITPTTAPLPAAVATPLVDAQATPATRGLLTYLRGVYGTKVLAGQHASPQDTLAELRYVQRRTGKEAALACFDLIEYSPSRRANGSNPRNHTEQYLAWARHGNGRGIVSLMWHWNAPTDLINSATNPWWRGFYTDASTFDVQAVLADPTGARYQLLLRDIDSVAVQLRKFQTAGVPVLWRPLHEAQGAWFWWGAKGPAVYRQLWQLLYNRLTTHHQLHNLIWVYSGVQNPSNAWYPGDAYVDIAGVDLYLPPSANMSGDWAGLQTQFGGRKLVALTESGNLPDPVKIRAFATWWSWFSVWEGANYIRGQAPALLQRVYNDQDVITLDELPDWAGTTVTATRTPLAPDALALYPNPATGYSLNANLTLPKGQAVTLTLTNALGQQVRQQTAQLQAGANTFQLPIGELSSGLYLLTVQGAAFPAVTKRVQVQH